MARESDLGKEVFHERVVRLDARPAGLPARITHRVVQDLQPRLVHKPTPPAIVAALGGHGLEDVAQGRASVLVHVPINQEVALPHGCGSSGSTGVARVVLCGF